MTKHRYNWLAASFVLTIALSGCGTPAVIIAGNWHDMTATPAQVVLQPTAQPPTLADMEMATSVPVTIEPVTRAASDGPTATELVIIYVLFGTPTSTISAHGASSQPIEATSGVTASIAPSASPASATSAPTQVVAEPTIVVSATTISAVGKGDAANGKNIFASVAACSACHDVQAGVVLVGPSLKGVATRAGSREPGKSASDYLHESIVAPNAYVVKGFQPSIMPQNFAQTLSTQQIDDVVAYLLTLK